MGQQSKGDDNLVKKTLMTTAAMMGVSVLFVGGLSLIASSAAGRAVGAPADSAEAPVGAAAGAPPHGEVQPATKALNRRNRGAAKPSSPATESPEPIR